VDSLYMTAESEQDQGMTAESFGGEETACRLAEKKQPAKLLCWFPAKKGTKRENSTLLTVHDMQA